MVKRNADGTLVYPAVLIDSDHGIHACMELRLPVSQVVVPHIRTLSCEYTGEFTDIAGVRHRGFTMLTFHRTHENDSEGRRIFRVKERAA